MFKLSKFLKPYIFSLTLAVILLYTQVNMNLALPDLMSKIVNIGIQQGGIADVEPEVISSELFNGIKDILDNSDKEFLSRLYTPINDSSYLQDKYENINDYKVLVLDSSIQISSDFSLIFAKSLLILNKIKITDLQGDTFLIQKAKSIIRNEYIKLGANLFTIQRTYLFKTGAIMLLVTILSVICSISVAFIASKTSAGTAKSIRLDLFSKIESFSSAEFDNFSTASLITRSTNDISQVQTIVFMMIRMVTYAPLMGIGGFFRALKKAPSMGWIIGLAVIILLSLIATIITLSMPKFKTLQKLVDRLNLVARENLSGILVVRAFNRETFEMERFDEVNRELTSTNLFIARTMVIIMPMITLIMNSLTILIIWIGSKYVSLGTIQIGDMMAFIQYAMQIVMSFMMLSMFFIQLPRASVSAKRISEVLSIKPSIIDIENVLHIPNKPMGKIDFKNVSFRYPKSEVDAITDITFTVEPGTTTAIIGSTGSGKSTIANLIPRFYDVTKGSIYFDGFNIKEMSQKELRDNIGFVPQKNVLFSGTIGTNLKYGNKNGSNDSLDRICEIAQASEFINNHNEKYDYEISQNGSNVSGGQRQRLAISRALMKGSPLYIFDDSFSALDFKTDVALRDELKKNIKGSTIILIAQRISTIMNAEQIIVLENGIIVGKGNHRELIDRCAEYREIAISQLGIKEGV